ncbi:MAG: hypothetical protein C4291_13715 [Candidatus Dadabacteria bacterium]
MNLVLELYKDNIEFLKTTVYLTYETLSEFYRLWSHLLGPTDLTHTLKDNYREESVEGIQKKAFNFLSKLYDLCESDQTKGFNMYEIGDELGYSTSEAEFIVETLSRAELIRHEKSSNEVRITPYGIMTIKGEITVGYAPIH